MHSKSWYCSGLRLCSTQARTVFDAQHSSACASCCIRLGLKAMFAGVQL